MSLDCSDSESSSKSDFSFSEDFLLCNDLYKMKPYSFEPLLSSSSPDENEDTECITSEKVEQTDDKVETQRVENVDWCSCKCCKPMDSEAEILY